LRARGFSSITRESIINGLASATHHGRLELVAGTPPVLLDGAHNPAGAMALRAYLNEFSHAPLTIIFGAMRDKDLTEIAAVIFPVADQLILTTIDNPRAAAPDTLRALIPPSFDRSKLLLASSASEALRLACDLTPGDGLVCVTGSLYLVGEIKSSLARARRT
jgi:dihydrofolate synthase/folylpolyglutamate synthase